jgi:hypothetical protein
MPGRIGIRYFLAPAASYNAAVRGVERRRDLDAEPSGGRPT